MNLLVSLVCVFLLTASKLVKLYLVGNYQLNRINPAYFDSVVGREKFLLCIHSEVEAATMTKAFQPLVLDLKMLAVVIGAQVEDAADQPSLIWEALRIAKVIQRRLQV